MRFGSDTARRAQLAWVPAAVCIVVAAGCGGLARPAPPRAGGIDPSVTRDLSSILDQQRAFYGLPGAAAAVVIPGRGEWSGGSGVRDRASGAPVSGGTPFAIASLTKPFIGALAAKLAEEGRIRLDDPISPWVPRWPGAGRITLRELLTQTSGVTVTTAVGRRELDAVRAHPRRVWSPARALRYVARPAPPGRRWEYNDANYVLAGLVLERETQTKVAALLHRLILDPLRLDDVALQPQDRERRAPAHGYARSGAGPDRDLSDGSAFVPFTSLASATWTGGAVVASAASVARFGDALLRGALLRPAMRRQMLTTVPADGVVYSRYGLGVGQTSSARLGRDVWAVYGGIAGFSSCLLHDRRTHVTAVVLANDDGATLQVAQIADLLLADAARTTGAR